MYKISLEIPGIIEGVRWQILATEFAITKKNYHVCQHLLSDDSS